MSDEAIPYRFADAVSIGPIAPAYEDLVSGESSGTTITVAGRLMLSRPQGKVAFANLRDWTGTIQLFAMAKVTDRFEEFVRLSLGDWIGVTGEIIRTKRGELSVRVERWEMLAHARRGFGDKWRGVNDIEVRHRQREVDLWANEGVRETFLARSKVIQLIRRRLDERGYVEVETPVLQPVAGGANARPFVTYYNALHSQVYLRIATELYLKRLVVGGFERVYELGKDFRNEGLSPRHNPEFTILEAYQTYADYLDMATLIETLVSDAAKEITGSMVVTHQDRTIDLTPPWKRRTLPEAIFDVTGVECSIDMGEGELRRIAGMLDVHLEDRWGAGHVLAEIYEQTAEHHLWEPTHVIDYPEEVSPLARRHRSKEGLVERLTSVVAGREIAEAYSELVDPVDQRERLEAQAAARDAGDEEAMVVDEDFLRALERGMPPTGGIGLGIDRVVMLLTDKSNIREVILFPALRRDPREGQQSDGDKTDDDDINDVDGGTTITTTSTVDG